MIIWNHRWEFDKKPEIFFRTLDALHLRKIDFRLALLGENFQTIPKEFIAARERYGDRIVRYGYVQSKAEYREWLRRGTIVVSTAIQENFGISVVEAIRYGCMPLLPDRLSYPEIIPNAFHDDFLYENQEDLFEKLSLFLSEYPRYREKTEQLSDAMACFSWENLIDRYDEELERLANGGRTIG